MITYSLDKLFLRHIFKISKRYSIFFSITFSRFEKNRKKRKFKEHFKSVTDQMIVFLKGHRDQNVQ